MPKLQNNILCGSNNHNTVQTCSTKYKHRGSRCENRSSRGSWYPDRHPFFYSCLSCAGLVPCSAQQITTSGCSRSFREKWWELITCRASTSERSPCGPHTSKRHTSRLMLQGHVSQPGPLEHTVSPCFCSQHLRTVCGPDCGPRTRLGNTVLGRRHTGQLGLETILTRLVLFTYGWCRTCQYRNDSTPRRNARKQKGMQ